MKNISALVKRLSREATAIARLLEALKADADRAQPTADRSVHDYAALAAHFASVVGQLLIASKTEEACLGGELNGATQKFILEHLGPNDAGSARAKIALDYVHKEIEGYRDLTFENAEDAFDFACELRSLCATKAFLDDADLSGSIRVIEDAFIQAIAHFSDHTRQRLQTSIRALLAGYCMYPWSPFNGRTLKQTHQALFQTAGFFEERNMKFGVSGLDVVFERSRADSHVRESVGEVLDVLQSALSDGIDLFDSFGIDRETLPWPISDITRNGQIMIIPGEGGNKCAAILLAVAHSSKRTGKLAPKTVMTKVQQAIIRCGGTLKAVIFLADPATQGSEVEDHIPIIQDFIAAGAFDVFVPVVSLGRRLTVLDWK